MSNINTLIFFLGGYDLEMLTIRKLLEGVAPDSYYDKHLSWGAKASDYFNEINSCIDNERLPVLIELENDVDLTSDKAIFLNHHNEKSGIDKPTPLHEVFRLLKLPDDKWTRWYDLVVANDRGYIPAMLNIGASKEEIIKVRSEDRQAQGITKEEEEQAINAIKQLEILAEGMLTVVTLPHSHTSPVSDMLHPELGGVGYRNLLVLSPKEVNFFGDGHHVIALNKYYPGGWYGGALPERGFWGCSKQLRNIQAFLVNQIKKLNIK